MHHFTNFDIEKAKKSCSYSLPEAFHQHPDCIRIAYEWLDAQVPTRNRRNSLLDLKHLIERWAGRYVSLSDVEVAASLLRLKGTYPCYNFSTKLLEPNVKRLEGISEAFSQKNSNNFICSFVCRDSIDHFVGPAEPYTEGKGRI